MIRVLSAMALIAAAAGCQQPTTAAKTDAGAPPAASAAAKTEPVAVAYAPDPAEADGDAEFRGPMTLQESAGEGAQKRYRFTWMGGKHIVIAAATGAADGKAVIDADEQGKPLTLAAALGAKDGEAITLLQVEAEDGPGPGDPDFTPLCGVRVVEHIAMRKTGDTVALATTAGNFGAPGARGCSNLMLYKKAP